MKKVLVSSAVALAVAAIVLVVSRAVLDNRTAASSKEVRGSFGQTLSQRALDAQVTGIARLTVYGISYPVAGQPFATAYPGDEYVVAHASYCAGPSGSPGLVSQDFHLTVQDGRSVGGRGDHTEKQPDLGGVQVLKAGRCARGYIAFEIAKGTTPDGVGYDPSGGPNYAGSSYTYYWSRPPS